jgi:uncharacterized SAM-binding protein YcdF (DUF218 family)
MFFVLSKTAAYLLLPSNLLIGIGCAGVILVATRLRTTGVRLSAISLVLLALAGFLPLGNLLARPLEARFPPWDARGIAPAGVIVLGGEISPGLSDDYGEPVMGDSGRIIAMFKLARLYPAARIVYSGGDASLLGNQLPEANYVYPLLDTFGIPRDRVTLETRSRNTAENAAYTRDLVTPKPGERWLLVTSAQHMPRAVGCFRKVGFPVEAYPVGWRLAREEHLSFHRALAQGLERFDSAVHEWIGLFAYWITGKTSEFLPGP